MQMTFLTVKIEQKKAWNIANMIFMNKKQHWKTWFIVFAN